MSHQSSIEHHEDPSCSQESKAAATPLRAHSGSACTLGRALPWRPLGTEDEQNFKIPGGDIQYYSSIGPGYTLSE